MSIDRPERETQNRVITEVTALKGKLSKARQVKAGDDVRAGDREDQVGMM